MKQPLLLVLVMALCLPACGGKVIVDSSGSPSPGTPSACALACDAQNQKGHEYYDVVSSECLCTVNPPAACTDSCVESVCDHKETPSDACLPCVKALLVTEQCMNAGLFGSGCLGHSECNAYIDCLQACN